MICDGRIECNCASGGILIATGPVKDKGGGSPVPIFQNAREALGIIKFYDPRQAGIDVKERKGQLVVEKVLEGKAFAGSGMRAGDRILAIDGTKVASLQALCSLLRHNALANKETAFTVERADQRPLDLKVRLTD